MHTVNQENPGELALRSVELFEEVASAYLLAIQERLAPPLFHGTDRAVLEMDVQERSRYLSACKLIIASLVPVYLEHRFYTESSSQAELVLNRSERRRCTDLVGEDLIRKIMDAFGAGDMALRGVSLYEHGALFLTSDPGKAENYAKRAFICGETGYSAYWLYRGARWFGYEMPHVEGWDAAVGLVEEACARGPEPVVVMLTGVGREDLLWENGEKVEEDSLNPSTYLIGPSLRCLADIDLRAGLVITREEFDEFEQVFTKAVETVQGRSRRMGREMRTIPIEELRAAWHLPFER